MKKQLLSFALLTAIAVAPAITAKELDLSGLVPKKYVEALNKAVEAGTGSLSVINDISKEITENMATKDKVEQAYHDIKTMVHQIEQSSDPVIIINLFIGITTIALDALHEVANKGVVGYENIAVSTADNVVSIFNKPAAASLRESAAPLKDGMKDVKKIKAEIDKITPKVQKAINQVGGFARGAMSLIDSH